ncbi:MAG TPA: ATP-binding protein [Thermoanaerobaculia bacterium]|nr:ATP-binding protein [Thermoanaerobaculia bacterium]
MAEAPGALREDLRRIAVFADLADDELDWLAEHVEELAVQPGGVLVAEGAPAEWMFIVLEGEIRSRRDQTALDGLVIRAGEITGMLPFSRMTSFPVTVRAVTPLRIARLNAAHFPEMLRRIPALEPRLVALLTDRVREVTRLDQEHDKLMALGRLSAGLAHELNNPAAAIRRTASELRERLATWRQATVELSECGLAPGQMRALAGACHETERREAAADLDPISRSERESEIADWLEARRVERGWLLAPTFAAAGATPADLDGLAAQLPARALPAALAWLEVGLAAEGLLAEVEGASKRISDLVAAVKSYSHMGEGEGKREVQVHRELDGTLTMLAPKARGKGITIAREYAPDLPRICGFAGELIQVFTNLLDNALDAAGPGGHVAVRTARDGDHVAIEIRDDGPGIPREVQGRIFDPFFTTKPVGEGSGLGLDIARGIVVRRHGGQLSFTSVPGDTRFAVRLPIGLPA